MRKYSLALLLFLIGIAISGCVTCERAIKYQSFELDMEGINVPIEISGVKIPIEIAKFTRHQDKLREASNLIQILDNRQYQNCQILKYLPKDDNQRSNIINTILDLNQQIDMLSVSLQAPTDEISQKLQEWIDKSKELIKKLEQIKKDQETDNELNKAENLYRDGIHQTAIEILTTIINENKGSDDRIARAYNIIGKINTEQQMYKDAIDNFFKASNKNPKERAYKRNLCQAYIYNKEAQNGVDVCVQLLKEEPQNIRTRNLLGLAYIDINEFNKAEEILKKLFEELKPNSHPYYELVALNLAKLYAKKVDKNEKVDINERNAENSVNYLNKSIVSLCIFKTERQDHIDQISVQSEFDKIKDFPIYINFINNLKNEPSCK